MDPQRCIKCGSKDISVRVTTYDADMLFQYIWCTANGCNAEWTNMYRLIDQDREDDNA